MNKNDLAFSRPGFNYVNVSGDMKSDDGTPGLTKREYFAASFLSGIAANTNFRTVVPDDRNYMAELSVALADLLIKQLDNKNEV